MTPVERETQALPSAEGVSRTRVPNHGRFHLVAAFAAFWLVAILAIAPSPPSPEYALANYVDAHSQSLDVSAFATVDDVTRDDFDSSPGINTLKKGATNEDWAKMVMMFGGWPQSENNVTVMLRWMRQENYTDSWWNRNNPLNNGWGSGGGGGTGSYANLVIAAQMAAENLHRHPGFQTIVDAFANSLPTDETEARIWASPWASGHYANGAHWHYNPVDVVKAPGGAWG